MPRGGQNKIDIAGQRYGRLTVLQRAQKPSGAIRGTWWLCRCDCGELKRVNLTHLRSGRAKSCGCWRRDSMLMRNFVRSLVAGVGGQS